MSKVFFVGIGGFIGASLRYIISIGTVNLFGENFPYGTLFANVLASFLIGLIMEVSATSWSISPEMKLLLTTGILGGLSTFSTFSYETIGLLSKSFFLGGLNIVLNLVFALVGVWLGKLIFA